MAITHYDIKRSGDLISVRVTSDLPTTAKPAILSRLGESGSMPRPLAEFQEVAAYYHWYLEGVYIASTGTNPSHAFHAQNNLLRLEVIDSTDPDFDFVAGAPLGYPSGRELHWTRALDAAAVWYDIFQRSSPPRSAGLTRLGPAGAAPRPLDPLGWTRIARVRAVVGQWSYRHRVEALDDLSIYSWRIVALDAAGNESSVLTIGPTLIVRTPDAPEFTMTFDPSTTKATFTEAA